MRQRLLVPALVLLAACSGPKTATPEAAAPEAAAPAAAASYVASHDALVAMKEKFADIDMDPDVSFLSDEDKKVVNLLNQAADIMSTIYMRQRDEDNPKWRAEIAASDLADKDLVLKLFDLNFGPWDSLDSDKPFYGSTPLPDGAGFYPTDMTREEFEKWIAAHPEDEKAFKSPYTVIRRDANGGLKAIAYSEYYKEQLEPAAALLREAARITSNASLKRFLILRADAFLSDDYYESELAWMDLDGPIEVAIGPYEVYTDRLFGYKTAFEAFVTAKDPSESAAVAKYKNYLHDMEANLPADDRYKNFKRGAASPISVARQVHGGGDNAAGIQIVAFNLPNDERVREAKGAKKVLLSNVLDAKFETILQPMAEHVLVPDQAALLVKKYMGLKTLFHELSHSMGPGKLVIDGRETTVGAELKELYSAVEEGKADVMGAWNILYMMQRGELPAAEKNNFLATYFVDIFRSMRFGTNDAHGRGAAFQYHYIVKNGGAVWDADAKRYRLDFAKFEQAIKNLTHDVVVVEGNGDYDAANKFLDDDAVTDANALAVIATLSDIPVDIAPHYKDKI